MHCALLGYEAGKFGEVKTPELLDNVWAKQVSLITAADKYKDEDLFALVKSFIIVIIVFWQHHRTQSCSSEEKRTETEVSVRSEDCR